MTPHQRGTNAEIVVQKKLWTFGYKAIKPTNNSKGTSFNLLIEGKIRVEVRSTVMKSDGKWVFTFSPDDRADILALVFFYPDGHYLIRFAKWDIIKRDSKYHVSPRTKGTRSFKSPSDEGLFASPFKVFGYPQSKRKEVVDL